MSNNALYIPRKRKDLKELMDKILKLRSSIKLKEELEQQISDQKKLVKLKKWIGVSDLLLLVISLKYFLIRRFESKIEVSKLTMDIEVKIKQMKIYHKNELLLEEELQEVKDESKDRFDVYIRYLEDLVLMIKQSKKDKTKFPEEFPENDVMLLHHKYWSDPPKNRIDHLSFYLTMEELLSRCANAKATTDFRKVL